MPRTATNGAAGSASSVTFRPLVINGLYTGIERGLMADVLATRARGGMAHHVCTAHIVASHGRVTDVVTVPSDTVDAQLTHLAQIGGITGKKIGIVGDAASARTIFRRLTDFDGPALLDLTLSGPSGEDIIDSRTLDVMKDHLGRADLTMIRRTDASLLAGMEIHSLDDAQVAVQRLEKLGARAVLLRCGTLPARHFSETDPEPFDTDVYYDGGDFALFETPHFELPQLHGASSVLALGILSRLVAGTGLVEAIQAAEGDVAQALKASYDQDIVDFPVYFWREG